MRDTCDIAVVGAGPAGSSCAASLARRGYDVTLIDQNDFPREKPCGDGLTPHAVEMLAGLGLRDLLESAQPVFGCRVVVDHRHERWPVRYPDSAPTRCLERFKLDDALRRVALSEGARFVKGRATGITDVTTDAPCVSLVGEAPTPTAISARVVAACDGATSVLRRSAVLGTPGHAVRAWAIRGYYNVERPLDPCFDVYVPLEVEGRSMLGYGWVFPVSEHLANIGVGYFRPSGPDRLPRVNRALDAFVEDLRRRSARRFGDIEALGRASGAPLAFNFCTSEACQGNLLLVGDAAGTTEPFTGEGIEPALRGGVLASEQIVAALTRGSALSLHPRDVGRLMPRAGQDFSSIARKLARWRDDRRVSPGTVKRLRYVAEAMAEAPCPDPLSHAATPVADLLWEIDPAIGSAVEQVHGSLQDEMRDPLPLATPALARELREQGGPVFAAACLLATLACGGAPHPRMLLGAQATEQLAPFTTLLGKLSHRSISDLHAMNNGLAILAADLTVSQAMSVAADLGARTARDFARTARRMCEGAVLDDARRHDLERSVEDYLTAVELQTGSLLSFAVGMGAESAGAPGPLVERVRRYGAALGVAYRLSEEVRALGTPDRAVDTLKDAARHGVYTLPLLIGCHEEPALRRALIAHPDEDDLAGMAQRLHSSGAVRATHRLIADHVEISKAMLGAGQPGTLTWFDVFADWFESRSAEALDFGPCREATAPIDQPVSGAAR
jgi:menaquinone-9 beta-reductase